MWGKSLGLRRLLRRWSEAGPALSSCSCHDASKEIARSMSDRWRRWVRRPALGRASEVGGLTWATSSFQLMPQSLDVFFISVCASVFVTRPSSHDFAGLLGFDLNLSLLQIVNLSTNKLHLVDLSGDYVLKGIVSRIPRHAGRRWQVRKLNIREAGKMEKRRVSNRMGAQHTAGAYMS
jgi:hypothetical protein